MKSKFPPHILRDIRESRGLDRNDASQDDEIEKLCLYSALEACLSWNGIHGFTHSVVQVVRVFYPEQNLEQALSDIGDVLVDVGKAYDSGEVDFLKLAQELHEEYIVIRRPTASK